MQSICWIRVPVHVHVFAREQEAGTTGCIEMSKRAQDMGRVIRRIELLCSN